MPHSTAASAADIDHRFDYHPSNSADHVAAHESVRAACKDLARKLDSVLPVGREKALALTKIEEALSWANAAIARELD